MCPIVQRTWHRETAKESKSHEALSFHPWQERCNAHFACLMEHNFPRLGQTDMLLLAMICQGVPVKQAYVAKLTNDGRRRNGLTRCLRDTKLWSAAVVVVLWQTLGREVLLTV